MDTKRRALRVAGFVTTVVALTAGVPRLRAQDVALSLEGALDLAERQNPAALARLARAEAEGARAQAAARASWPRVSLATGWWRSDTPSRVFAQKLDSGDFGQDDFAIGRLLSPGARSHLSTTLVAEAPLDLSGAVRSRAASLSATARASDAAATEDIQDLRLRVVEAYRAAALARRLVEVAERALAAARSREGEVEARVQEGASLSADLLRVRARRRQREADVADRRAQSAVARAVLAQALGSEPGVSYLPTDDAPAPSAPAGELSWWQEQARATRPLLRAAVLGLEARRRAQRAEERAGWPEVAAWAMVQDDRGGLSHGERSGALGVQVRWPAFDAARGRRVAAAAAETRAADLDLRAARDRARLEVETAWWKARSSRERHAAAAGGAAEGREALRILRERRRQGLATVTDELETEAAALEAEVGEARAATEAALADASLRRAAGGL